MHKWTKEHSRFVGRVIFANFLKFPLERYKNIIEEVERSICCEGGGSNTVTVRNLSKANISNEKANKSSKVIAEIVKNTKGFSIRYVYEGFNKIYVISGNPPHSKLFYKLRRISSRNELTHRIIEGVVEHQKKFLSTGEAIDLLRLSQVQLTRSLRARRSPQLSLRQAGCSHLAPDAISCSLLVAQRPWQSPTSVDISWVSRLVNRLSVITPSGEERMLKAFFPTQKDINKRLIKKLLDKENEDIESGKLKKPLTDNQIRAKLETKYGLSLSRWSVGHCRKDMGIPPAKRRLSGYKYPPISANFSAYYPLTREAIQQNCPAVSGVYEFSIKNNKGIGYPYSGTKVFYIGSTTNIKKRLKDHLSEGNKNGNIKRFLKTYRCLFRYIKFPYAWKEEERKLLELFFSTYGSLPKGNRLRGLREE